MREIKFRAWDHVNNKIIYPDEDSWSEMDDWVAWENEKGSSTNQGVVFELMQYTGLKDKNGKEIYEGDIVCYNMIDNEEICEVFWDAGSVRMRFKERSGWCSYSVHTDDVSKRVEIIGNIYENPELLEEK